MQERSQKWGESQSGGGLGGTVDCRAAGVRRLGTQSLETAREIPRRLLPFITHHTTSLVLGCAGHTMPAFSLGFFVRILCVVLSGNLLGFFFFT